MKNLDAVSNPEDVPTKAYVDNVVAVSTTQPTGSEIWLDLNTASPDSVLLDKGTADTYYVNSGPGGDTMQGNLALDNTAFLSLNAPAVSTQNIEFRVGDLLRWTLGRDNTAESGANTGSNFAVAAWNDAGGFIKRAVTFIRSTGLLTVAGDPTDPLGVATKQYVDGKAFYGTRNRIINGDFSVNQRGFTSSTTAGLGFDRWQLNHSGTGTNTHSVQTPVLGELPESAKNYWRIATSGQSAAGDYCTGFQRIEGVRTLSGKIATVSFWAKASTGTPKIAVEFEQVFGTGGTPSAAVQTLAGQITLSTTWTRYSVTVGIPSIAGKTLGTAGDDLLRLVLWLSAGSNYSSRTGSLGPQAVTVDFWGVQVEEGTYASPYEQKPYRDELRAAQRYFYRIAGDTTTNTYGYVGTGMTMSATGARIGGNLPVSMRAIPTTTLTGSLSVRAGTAGAVTAVINLTGIGTVYFPTSNPDRFFTDSTVASGLTAGYPLVAYMANATGNYLDFNAEL
jgi:hypothetical protein